MLFRSTERPQTKPTSTTSRMQRQPEQDTRSTYPSRNNVQTNGATSLEQNDEWTVQRARYMTLETIAPLSDDAIVNMPVLAN